MPPAVFGVAVTEGFRLAWSEVSGAPQDRLFQAGSVAKPVTALAALALADRGEIGLDADVNRHLVSWQLPGQRPATLRQLLGHTAGTGVPFYPGYPRSGPVPTPLQSLAGEPPAVTPPVLADPAAAGRFSYSGAGYAVVQQLIADVTGLPFASAIGELVLGPLGMRDSTFEQPLPARCGRLPPAMTGTSIRRPGRPACGPPRPTWPGSCARSRPRWPGGSPRCRPRWPR